MYFGLVDEICGCASAGERTFLLLSAVAGSCFTGDVFPGDFVVVGFYYGGHIVHAAVAKFDCVSVDYPAELVFFGEVFVDEAQELFADVGGDVLTVRGVEPSYVPFPLPFCPVGVAVGVIVLWCVG